MNDISDQARIAALKKDEKARATFAQLKDVMSLIDLTSNSNKSTSTYSREQLRTYLKNPAADGNQKSLRKLSEYLFTVSHVYRRLVTTRAAQVDCKSWICYPITSFIDDNNTESLMKDYDEVTHYVEALHLDTQIFKCCLKAWQDDVVYGFTYGNPAQDGEFFIHILDPDYCKISSQHYFGGQLNFAFDFSFFDGTNAFYLDVYDPIFKKLYNKYTSDNSLRWQELPIERTFCLKVNIDNAEYPIPPLSGLFESIISLVDLQGIQDVADELNNFKLLYAKIDTLSGTKEVDDFEIDLELANQFWQKISTALPDHIGFALSPMTIESVDLGTKNNTDDTDMISRAYSNIVEANGDTTLITSRISNSTAFKMAMMSDSMPVMKLVDQINVWVNLRVRNDLNIETIRVEYSNISPYFREDRINLLLKLGQYGAPVKTELVSLAGITPIKERGLSFIEEQLGLGTTAWNHPLVSSNTQSGNVDNGDGSDGRPKSDEGDLSDEGLATRDGDKNA